MEITETGGTWKTATMSRNNACFGRQVPIQHDRATSDSLDMTLKFSDVITGCNNATVKLRLDDKGTIEWQDRPSAAEPPQLHHSEPLTPMWKRAMVKLLSWLPIEWLL